MSTLFVISALGACSLSAVAGAIGMRFYVERRRVIAEREDPRNTKIRDLQATVKLAQKDLELKRTSVSEQAEHLKMAHARIDELLDRIGKLGDKYATSVVLLEKEIEAKDALQEKLSVAKVQLENIKEQNQEMALQLRVNNEADMLGEATLEPNSSSDKLDDGPLVDMFSTPPEEDDSPSLIQSLTGELDRWKHHCHVLGNELKHQRERITPESVQRTVKTADNIDELTDIRGICAVLARKLHAVGIFRFQDLVELSGVELERAQTLIPDLERRMTRDDWIDQARNLYQSKYQSHISR
jgi:predicted flap endonuclease-1-like 5' DNA nuclease